MKEFKLIVGKKDTSTDTGTAKQFLQSLGFTVKEISKREAKKK